MVRKLSKWNLFVKHLKKENPKLSFKELLVKASQMKKDGKMENFKVDLDDKNNDEQSIKEEDKIRKKKKQDLKKPHEARDFFSEEKTKPIEINENNDIDNEKKSLLKQIENLKLIISKNHERSIKTKKRRTAKHHKKRKTAKHKRKTNCEKSRL
jgi:hypothetical protein